MVEICNIKTNLKWFLLGFGTVLWFLLALEFCFSWKLAIQPKVLVSLNFYYYAVVNLRMVWMRMAPIDAYIWTFSSQLVKLFGKDQEVWFCWKRFATGGRFWDSKKPQLALSTSYLQITVSAKPAVMFPVWAPRQML